MNNLGLCVILIRFVVHAWKQSISCSTTTCVSWCSIELSVCDDTWGSVCAWWVTQQPQYRDLSIVLIILLLLFKITSIWLINSLLLYSVGILKCFNGERKSFNTFVDVGYSCWMRCSLNVVFMSQFCLQGLTEYSETKNAIPGSVWINRMERAAWADRHEGLLEWRGVGISVLSTWVCGMCCMDYLHFLLISCTSIGWMWSTSSTDEGAKSCSFH